MLNPKLVGWLMLASVVILLSAWAGYRLAPSPGTVTRFVDRVVTQTITTKPDGTVVQQTTDSTVSKPDPTPAKPSYSVGVTSPVSDPSVQRVGVEVGVRIVKDFWGVIGYQEDQGPHVGVRFEW